MSHFIHESARHLSGGHRTARRMRCAALLAALGLPSLALSADGDGPIDLLQRYPVTQTSAAGDPAEALRWRTSPRDVYRLHEFELNFMARLRIATGPADLVIGHGRDGALWAVVLPDAPGTASGTVLPHRCRLAHVWLQFHPRDLDRLFPSAGVRPASSTTCLSTAKVIAWFKTGAPWAVGSRLLLPPPGAIVADFDTGTGQRHRVRATLQTAQAVELPQAGVQPVPAIRPLTTAEAVKAFERVWQDFDSTYSTFGLHPDVDWQDQRRRLLPLARQVRNDADLICLLTELLGPLRDEHARIEYHGTLIHYCDVARVPNVEPALIARQVQDLKEICPAVSSGALPRNLGYISIHDWCDPEIVRAFDQALADHHARSGLIIDVRQNGGGDESLAQQVAGRFTAAPRDYASSRSRSGPNHDQMSSPVGRQLRPRGPWTYNQPIAVLIGPACASSNEAFILMMKQCGKVILVGDRTAGSSGNPRWLDVVQGVRVGVPQWLDLMPNGHAIERTGIVPDIHISWRKERLGHSDAVLDAAVSALFSDRPAKRPGPATPAER